MKLNNKGFAISTIMYMILILAVVLVVLTLAVLSTRKLTLDKIKNEAEDNIKGKYSITYSEVISILKDEAISYGELNNVDIVTLTVEELNSTIDLEVLEGYNLLQKEIIIEKEGNTYSVYLDDKKL